MLLNLIKKKNSNIMSDLDIEDIGTPSKPSKVDTVEKPSCNDEALIQSVIESKDFENALDLFGDEIIDSNSNDKSDQDINILQYIPKTYVDFKKYEKAVINFFSNIPDDYKTEFAQKLIMKLIHPLNSYQIEDILETSSSLKST